MKYKTFSLKTMVTMALLLWLTMWGLAETQAAPSTEGASPVISEVMVSNVRDVSFTVSWITDQDSDGSVHIVTPAGIFDDDRGAATSDDTHYVTISGLSPNTTYNFDVVSGSTTSGGHSVTTGPTLGVPGSDTIFGEVFQSDGTTVAEGTIVKITLGDNNAAGSSGDAAPLSALVDANGFWNVNLGNARTSGLSAFFDYSASGDQVVIEAQCAGDGTASQSVDTADDAPAADMTCVDSETPNHVIYVSSNSSGSVGGIAFQDEDILAYDTKSGIWSMYFDGSDVGIGATDVNAFMIMDDGSILMSFDSDITVRAGESEPEEEPLIEDDEALMSQESQSTFNLANVGPVTDSDIVRFTPTSLGKSSAGTFTTYLTGSTVGLTTAGEDIDAIGFTPDGQLVISTLANYSVPGVSGTVSGADEDLIRYDGSSWALYFDGSDVQLTDSSEDVYGTWIDPTTGEIYFTTAGNFSAGGISGDKADIFSCLPISIGAATSCSYDLFWDGSEHGFGSQLVDAISLAVAPRETIYVTSNSDGSVGGVSFDDEDILAYDEKTGIWSMYFDGSDVGIGATDVNAFIIMDDGSILMSFDTDITVRAGESEPEEEVLVEDDEALMSQESPSSFNLPNVGPVTDSDIVRFTPTSLGHQTAGTFSLYLVGSTVGLTTAGEDIDAIALTPDGDLVISTLANFSVPGLSGADEDMIRYDGSNWAMYFDGSDVQLTDSSEDVYGTWIDSTTGQIYLTTAGNFSARGLTGDKADIFSCSPHSTGATTKCSLVLSWDGSAHGFGAEVVDGISLSVMPSAPETIYVSSNSSGSVGGISFQDEDILAYDTKSGIWSMYLDGSDVGIGATDVNAFMIMDDGSILMSFDSDITVRAGESEPEEEPLIEDDEALMSQESQSTFNLANVGPVTDSDIVRFTPTALGKSSAGTFTTYLTGSTVGLTTGGEDIDAIAFTPDGDLVISTLGSFSVPGSVTGGDEDLIVYDGSNWALYFDGSDVQLTASAEDVYGAWIDPTTGEIYLTTLGNFSVAGGTTGDKADIFSCLPHYIGATTRCAYASFWDGSAHGFGPELVDGISLAVAAPETIHVSSNSSGNAGGVGFADEDILAYDEKTGVWSMYFDGSDVGIAGTDINAFMIMDDGSILMSFDTDITVRAGESEPEEEPLVEDDEALMSQESQTSFNLPNVGPVTDSDIVRFIPTSLGHQTAGSFSASLYLDGSTVGLTTGGEDIDAIGLTPDGDVVISTLGNFSVPGLSGGDEDLIVYDGSSWAMYFDGSDVQLTATSEDVFGTWIDSATGQIYLTTAGNFSARGLTGDKADIFSCSPHSIGATTKCSMVLSWDGSAHGFGPEVVDGLALVRNTPATSSRQVYELVEEAAPTSIELTSLSTSNPSPFGPTLFIGVTLLLAVAGYGWHRRKK